MLQDALFCFVCLFVCFVEERVGFTRFANHGHQLIKLTILFKLLARYVGSDYRKFP